MVEQSTIHKKADTFKLLGDPTRLTILSVLFDADRELCVNEISHMVGASQSATSHQLAKLEARGIVDCFRRGQTVCYRVLNTSHTRHLREAISAF